MIDAKKLLYAIARLYPRNMQITGNHYAATYNAWKEG